MPLAMLVAQHLPLVSNHLLFQLVEKCTISMQVSKSCIIFQRNCWKIPKFSNTLEPRLSDLSAVEGIGYHKKSDYGFFDFLQENQ